MRIIGITGGVGSGKSEVMACLEKTSGAAALRADEVGHLLMKKGAVCYEKIKNLFGEEVLAEDGELDRKAIAARVFGQPQKLEALNAIVPGSERIYSEDHRRRAKKGQKLLFS